MLDHELNCYGCIEAVAYQGEISEGFLGAAQRNMVTMPVASRFSECKQGVTIECVTTPPAPYATWLLPAPPNHSVTPWQAIDLKHGGCLHEPGQILVATQVGKLPRLAHSHYGSSPLALPGMEAGRGVGGEKDTTLFLTRWLGATNHNNKSPANLTGYGCGNVW